MIVSLAQHTKYLEKEEEEEEEQQKSFH